MKIDDRGIVVGVFVSYCILLCGYNFGGIICIFIVVSFLGFGFVF